MEGLPPSTLQKPGQKRQSAKTAPLIALVAGLFICSLLNYFFLYAPMVSCCPPGAMKIANPERPRVGVIFGIVLSLFSFFITSWFRGSVLNDYKIPAGNSGILLFVLG